MMIRALVLLLLSMASPLQAEDLALARHEIGPWPVVSKLIGYRDRIWFANSVKGVNHNSADLYSIATHGGSPRYEGHLFSQDAGDPVVHGGLLYWPLEDARTEPGIGAFDVTDGRRWEHGLVPTEQAFHLHAMVVRGDSLYAALSAWKASIARSDDGGETWRTVYLHPTPDRRVSRITGLVVLGDGIYGTLSAPDGRRLIRVDDGSGEPVPGWPGGRSHGLVVHKGRLYGIAANPAAGGLIWRSDGRRSEDVWTSPDGWTPRALASDGEELWMAGDQDGEASLWTSPDGRDWFKVATLGAGVAYDAIAHKGVIAVGGRGDNDVGILWVLGPSSITEHTIDAPSPSWPSLARAGSADVDWADAAAKLDRLLADPKTYERYGGRLRQAILDLPRGRVPPEFYPERLDAPMPSAPLPMFGGVVLDRMADMGRWRAYWGVGLARSGQVDPADILRPWNYTPNRPAKFFSTPEIAIWVAGRLARPDAEVLDALVQRLEDQATPLWLKGDAVGALFSITGERLGYDAKAWRRWLDGRR
ncbi:MAG: PQQ-like beta-propeller repeat protein [Alphaproteobacteria bacterium]|nr:PQQ-like beta-propeller repeat protein [Alphaproteobacteria bacterium]